MHLDEGAAQCPERDLDLGTSRWDDCRSRPDPPVTLGYGTRSVYSRLRAGAEVRLLFRSNESVVRVELGDEDQLRTMGQIFVAAGAEPVEGTVETHVLTPFVSGVPAIADRVSILVTTGGAIDCAAALEEFARGGVAGIVTVAELHCVPEIVDATASGIHCVSNAVPDAGRLAARITERQLEILRLLASGVPNKQIARECLLSTATVKRELRSISDILGTHSRSELVSQAALLIRAPA